MVVSALQCLVEPGRCFWATSRTTSISGVAWRRKRSPHKRRRAAKMEPFVGPLFSLSPESEPTNDPNGSVACRPQEDIYSVRFCFRIPTTLGIR